MTFEDHFSNLAEKYAQYRPHYPTELFAYLASLTTNRMLAWDCATGSGQAALGLVDYFDRVVATDASEEQICHARKHEKIEYLVEAAEQTGFINHSVGLVTVATAVHWFDFDPFYAEVRRVLTPGGVTAVWTYHRPQISPTIDDLIAHFEDKTLAGYWPAKKKYLEDHYQTIPFPFEEIEAPKFALQIEWTAGQWLGFMNSWSAVRRYENERGTNPLELVWDDFIAAWGGEDNPLPIHYPLYLRVGRG